MPRVNVRIHRLTLVAAFFFPPYPSSKFSDILKVWANTLLIRVQSMKLRNGLASVTNPKGKGEFDLVEWRVECWWPLGQKHVCWWGAVLTASVCTSKHYCFLFFISLLLTFPLFEMSFWKLPHSNGINYKNICNDSLWAFAQHGQ